MKLDDEKCPMCKEPSRRVLITDNPNESLQDNWGTKIEDSANQLVFSRQEIWTEVRRKIGIYCSLCKDQQTGQPTRQFPTVEKMRDHYVSFHKLDYCKLCLEHKPVLLFQQTLYKYAALNKHVEMTHRTCWFCPHRHFYDNEQLNVHYRKDHFFCDVCRKLGRRMRQVSRQTNNLPEYEVFKDAEELRQHYKKNHHVCSKQECSMLVFEDGVQLSEHYVKVHGEKRATKVEFGFCGDSDEEPVEKKRPNHRVFLQMQRREQEEQKEIEQAVQDSLVQQQKQQEDESTAKKQQLFMKQDFPSLSQTQKKK